MKAAAAAKAAEEARVKAEAEANAPQPTPPPLLSGQKGVIDQAQINKVFGTASKRS
jgi:hypothetical protein